MDNIRFLLILLVVFGHMLETFGGTLKQAMYAGIYTFHMPCFLFLTGYFAKFEPARIVRRFVIPYLLFQVLYQVFDCWMLSESTEFALQFTTPYYHLWYLPVITAYYLLIPLIKTESKTKAVVTTAICIGISILAGFDDTIGAYMSLSRALVFLPFFVAGFYAKTVFSGDASGLRDKWRIALPAAAVLCMLACELLFFALHTSTNVFLGSGGYGNAGGNALTRLLFIVCGFAWTAILMKFVPNRKIPCISRIGANTLPVFLLHVFVQRLILHYNVFHYSQVVNLCLAALAAIAVIWVFSIRIISKFFKKLF